MDLVHSKWQDALRGAENAMVSYPLLIAGDGSKRVSGDSKWLANRSFVAVDHQGNIILGTTKEAFFCLDRLADFLRAAPLDLAMAPNLDGGPVACRGIRLGGYVRNFCGA